MNHWKRYRHTYLKWSAIALLAVIIVIGLVAGYRYWTKENEPAQAAVQRTAMVTRGSLTVTIGGTGSIEPVSTATVTAGIAGKIAKVLVQEGDTVAEGDVLAVFESSDNSRQIRLKELEIRESRMSLEELYEQYRQADDETRGEIELRIERQKLNIQMAEEELAELKDNQQDSQILAPIGGKITALNVKAGDTVNANAVVAEIADYSQLQITVPIDELDIPQVDIGQSATILVEAFPDRTFTGKVTKIADQGSYNNGVATFDVTVKMDDPGQIKAGMSAEASIQVASRENALLLPVDAVQSMGGRYFVIKADGVSAPAGQAQGFRPADRPPGGAGAGNAQQSGREGTGAQGQQSQQGRQGPQGAQSPQNSQDAPGQQTSPGTPNLQTRQDPAGAQSPQGQPGMQERQGAQSQQGTQGPQGGQARQGAQGRQGAQAQQDAQGATRVFVEVGISNEDFIEIVSGLSEGDIVLLPTVMTSPSGAQTGFPGGGFPGGGFPGGPGGGAVFFTGGGPGGGGGFTGGGGPGGGGFGGGPGARTGGSGGGR